MQLSQAEKTRLHTRYGPWAVVTGASSGIGRELATRLAESGLNLLLSARREPELTQLADELRQRYGIETRIAAADLSAPGGAGVLIGAARGLDTGLLVAAAGAGSSGEFIRASTDSELQLLQLNCAALLELSHHFARQFSERRRGGIVLMSSMVGFQGVPYSAHYAATKAYVQSLAEALHIELKPYGVDVLAAAPGPVQSAFGARADMRMNTPLKPESVGVPILRALGRRGTVLPGAFTKLLVWSLRTVPRWGKVRIMKLVMGGMTQHQRAGAA